MLIVVKYVGRDVINKSYVHDKLNDEVQSSEIKCLVNVFCVKIGLYFKVQMYFGWSCHTTWTFNISKFWNVYLHIYFLNI